MWIKAYQNEQYAGVRGQDLHFSPGVNVILGDNEAGKSTICAFIKFIFYGLSGKSTSGEMSERKRYLPFEELQNAVSAGYTEPWQLAEYFQLPETAVRGALNYYLRVRGLRFAPDARTEETQ